MRAPLSWIRDYVDLPVSVTGHEVAESLIRAGFEVERVDVLGADITGVVVGEVVSVEELSEFKKPIRFCQVRVVEGGEPRGVVCGASNFVVGDRVPVALPGGTLPGGFAITARETYGRTSDGMICSARELGMGDDHTGILVLPAGTPIGADVVELLSLRDEVLDIAVTPDRGYALSVRGLAREVATAYGLAFRDPAAVSGVARPSGNGYDVRLDEVAGCDRYVAQVIEGLDPSAVSPLWLTRRITMAGMRSISLAVDVTNHVMLDLGQPLHAFDVDRLSGPIAVRRAAAGERLTTLDGVDRMLEPADLVIADGSGPIAIAGVMGGANTEVTASTTRILIEAAHFDPVSVARTARRHKLPSEASRRFERGVDGQIQRAAAAAAARLLADLGGATVAGPATDVGVIDTPTSISLAAGAVERTAGRPYDQAVVESRLRDIGCEVITGSDGALGVTPPTWRADLSGPHDLVEEVIRLEGYDTIPSVLPAVPAGHGLTRQQRTRRRVERSLAENGYVEALSYPFVAPATFDALGLAVDDPRRAAMALVNPLSDAEPLLRTTLLPGLLASLIRNVGRGQPDLALYEVGLVWLDPPTVIAPTAAVDGRPSDADLKALDDALPMQPRYVAVALCGQRELPGWWGPGRAASWADAVEAARLVGRAAGTELHVVASSIAPWHPGRCAAILAGNQVVGYAGELHPRVVAALGLPPRTSVLELDLDAVIAAATPVEQAPTVSSFPVATQDVALVVAESIPAAVVEAALRAGAGELLESLRLFDVYEGTQVGEGKRSLAYALRFRATDRTLTVEEATGARDAAVAEAARQTGAVLRS